MQSNKPFSKLDAPTQTISGSDLMMISQETPEGWLSGKLPLGDFLNQVFGVGGPGYGKLTEFEDRLDSLDTRVTALENDVSVSDLAELIFHVGSKHMTDKLDWNPGRDLMGILGYETNWLLYPYIPAGVVSESAQLGGLVSVGTGSGSSSLSARRLRIWERLADGEVNNQLRLLASRTQINEGDPVTFTLITAGLNAGSRVKYKITGIDTLDIEQPLTGEFVTGDDGTATLTILTTTDRRTDGDKNMKITLEDYTSISSTVKIIDTSQAPAGLTIIPEGTSDTISIGPQMQAEIWVIGGGGGGGGSVYTPAYIPPDGEDGTASYITVSDKLIRANGGKKGTGGTWGNGSSYSNGSAGVGGTAEINDTASAHLVNVEIQYTAIQKGLDAVIGSRWATQFGASGNPDHFGIRKGGGGNGGWGIGDEAWSYGGGGGAGAFIKLIVKNRSTETISIYGTAGTGGDPWKSAGTAGTAGTGGVIQAMVSPLPAGDDGTLEFIYPTEDEVDILVNDYETAEIFVIGSGGGGGGQASTTTNVNTSTIAGLPGSKSYLLVNGVTLSAGGGNGGAGGLVGMGGGANGSGGVTSVSGPTGGSSYNESLLGSDITAVLTNATPGLQRNRTSPIAQQLGAEALTIGAMGAYGKGGDGSAGNGSLHTGGAGGSGSYFKYTVTNRTATIRALKAKAGKGGSAGVGQSELDYMQGLPGDAGLIIIRRTPLVNYDNQIVKRDSSDKNLYIPAGKLLAFGLVGGGGGSGGINNTGVNTATNDGVEGGFTSMSKWGITYKAGGGYGGDSATWSGSTATVNPSTPTLGGDVYVGSTIAIPDIPVNPVTLEQGYELVMYSAVKGGSSAFNSASPGGTARRIIRDTTYGDGAAGILRDIILANPSALQSAGGGAGGSARGFVYNATQTLVEIPVVIGVGGSGALNSGTSADGVHPGVNAKDGVAYAGVVDYMSAQKRRNNSNIRDLFIPPNRALRIRMAAAGGGGSGYRINPTVTTPKSALSGGDSWVRLNGLTYTVKGGGGGTETVFTSADGIVAGVGGLGGEIQVNGVALVGNVIIPNPAVTLPEGVTMTMTVAAAGANGTTATTDNGGATQTIDAELFAGGGDGVTATDGTAPWNGSTTLTGGGGGAGAYIECLIVNNGDKFIAVEANVGKGAVGLTSEGLTTNPTADNGLDGYITASLEDAPDDGRHFYITVGQAPAAPTNVGANLTVRGYSKNSNGTMIGTYDNRKLVINNAPLEVLYAGLVNTSGNTPEFQIGLKNWFFAAGRELKFEIENMNNGYRIETKNILDFGYATDFSGSENGTSTKETLRGWSMTYPSYTWDVVDDIVSKVFVVGDRLKVKVLSEVSGSMGSYFTASTRMSDSDTGTLASNVTNGQTVYAICKPPTDVKNQRFKVECYHNNDNNPNDKTVIGSQEFTNESRMVFPFVAEAPADGYRNTVFVWYVYNADNSLWYEMASSVATVYA